MIKSMMTTIMYASIFIFMMVVIGMTYMCFGKMKSKESFTNNDKLLFFYADWCGYCTQFKPEIEKLEASNIIQVERLNDRDTPSTTKQKYNIQGYPTVFYICDDKKKKIQFNGERTKEALEEFIMTSRK